MPGLLCTAPTPPGCSGSPGLAAGTSLSPARPCACVGRTANLPEKDKIMYEIMTLRVAACLVLNRSAYFTTPGQTCPTSPGKGGRTARVGPPSRETKICENSIPNHQKRIAANSSGSCSVETKLSRVPTWLHQLFLCPSITNQLFN